MKRLIDSRFPEGSAEEIAAAHLRGTAAMPDISATALARVSARLAAHAPDARERSRSLPWLRWRSAIVVVLAVVSIGSATAAAVWVAVPRVRALRAERPTLQPVVAREKRVPRAPDPPPAASDPIAGLSEPAVPAPAPAPAAASRPIARKLAMVEPPLDLPAPAAPAPAASTPPAAAAPPAFVPHGPAATATTRLALETELLTQALGRLRGNRDPQGALALLDQHALLFPRGTLAPEAEITRVDALLALDRRREAAAILNRLTLPSSARGRELLVVRAELAAHARSWEAAIADFTRALADPALAPELVERSLHGRAACHLGNRNPTAARADLDAYMRRFPDGRFAATTRETLRDLESNPR